MILQHSLSLDELLQLIGHPVTVKGDASVTVTGLNELHSVQKGDLSFADNSRYYGRALKNEATVILINSEETECPEGKTLLVTDDPLRDYLAVVEHFVHFTPQNTAIHPSAVIGEGTVIQPLVFIGESDDVLTLLKTVCSYWFYAYKASILTPAQKGYILTGASLAVTAAESLLHMAVLLLLRSSPALSYYLYCAASLVVAVVNNLVVKRIVDREYPYLKEKSIAPLPKEERTDILKNTVGMATNRVCQVLNDGIDSTIISALAGIVYTGVYSNYLVLRGMVNKALYMFFSSLHAGVGNFCATETPERKEEFLKTLHFTYFWLYGFCSISLWVLLRPFIAGVWLHDTRWLLSDTAEFLAVFNFLIEGLAGAVVKYRDVNGLYWQTRHRYVFSSVLNMALSIVLVGPMRMGVTGALLGTTVSLLVMLSFDPVLVYREVFGKRAGEFYLLYLRDLLLVLATLGLVKAAVLPFGEYTIGNFMIKGVFCAVIPNLLWYLLFRRSPQFVYLRDKVLGVLSGMRRG